MDEKLEYEVDARYTAQQISAEIDALWIQLGDKDSTLHAEALQAGIDLDEVASKARREIVDVKKGAANLGVTSWAMVVTFLTVLKPALNVAAVDVWKKLILPHLERRFGKNAVRSSSRKGKGT